MSWHGVHDTLTPPVTDAAASPETADGAAVLPTTLCGIATHVLAAPKLLTCCTRMTIMSRSRTVSKYADVVLPASAGRSFHVDSAMRRHATRVRADGSLM